jgi:hypothetical protein
LQPGLCLEPPEQTGWCCWQATLAWKNAPSALRVATALGPQPSAAVTLQARFSGSVSRQLTLACSTNPSAPAFQIDDCHGLHLDEETRLFA